ncbi:dephospho-CoA kinase [Arenimonas composti]|uniref:Dephospho-CoA kinase n=1 Tax=Arenimonas composti TR7-09 = DSM 18010 TaxID=1121013 RepID=A0A091BI95_9GAMM|nr:dephospho-CoA kinase [Arenimonas composti]KFN51272.1 hypothetical protein P873_03125 [Arenimonas composti TR7-09 = DSM 18010]
MADLVVALTGGVASGKSEASRAFEALGIAVADADVAARAVVEPGEPALAEIVAHFGPEVLDADGRLDRPAMRRRVFADAHARAALEVILHPRIRTWLRAAAEAAPGPYAVVAIPLLTEAGGRASYPWLRRIVVVDVSTGTQTRRLLARDGVDADLAARMIAAQAPRRQRLALADDLLINDGSREDLAAAVARLDARYRAMAEAGSVA